MSPSIRHHRHTTLGNNTKTGLGSGGAAAVSFLHTGPLNKTARLLGLLAEGAALREASETTGGLAEHHVAVAAEHDGLRMGEDRGDLEAAGALDVHEEGIGGLNQALELVLLLLLLRAGVQQVDIHGEGKATTQ